MIAWSDVIAWAGALVIGLVLGSAPFGLLLTRAAGLGDIRAIGSGNIGATNVLRTGRKGLAAATLLLDGSKGFVAVIIAGTWLGSDAGWMAALGAVLGHCHSIWLKGKGGKGVATGLGVLLAAMWPVGVACCVIWLAMARLVRISSVAALTALAAAPVLTYLAGDLFGALITLLIAIQIAVRHRANISRLLAGTEPRIGAKS
ncbi:MAG TPA: glycerol-3-phosphate 1-O-acyltransferase PlsY [Acetobacteraceae bacterium]|jgi:glycerol-3-phosphate acyltransferase PlsY